MGIITFSILLLISTLFAINTNINIYIYILLSFTTIVFFSIYKKKIILVILILILFNILSSMQIYKSGINNNESYHIAGKIIGDKIKVNKINNKYVYDRIYLNIDREFEGESIELDFICKKIDKFHNILYLTGEMSNVKLHNNFLKAFIKKRIYKFSYIYGGNLYGFLLAIFLGDNSELNQNMITKYRYTGVSHLLVISGLHMGILLFLSLKIFDKLKFNYYLKYSLTLVVLTIYIFITGALTSVLRAYIMIVIYILSKLAFEKADPLKSLFIAIIINIIINPTSIISVSFILSYLAVLSLLIVYPKIKMNIFKFDFLNQMIFITLSIQLILAPIFLYNFNIIPFLSFFSNIIVVTLGSFIIGISFILIFIGIFSTNLAIILAFLVNFLLKILNFYVDIFSKISFMQIKYKAKIPLIFIMFFYIAIFIIMYKEKIEEKLKIYFLKSH